MRSIFKVSLLAASIALAGCGEKPDVAKTDAVKTDVAKTDVAKTDAVKTDVKAEATKTAKVVPGAPQTDLEKQSYGLGVSFGNYLKRALDENNKVEVNLDIAMVMNGVTDAVEGTEKLTKEEIETVMKELDALTRAKHAEMAEKVKAEALKAGSDFLAEHAKKEGVKTTESGLQYTVVTMGEGKKPGPKDRVKVHYKGTLIDGLEFDSSYKRDEPAVFGVGQVIKGWTEGLQLMPVGSKFTFAIPSELAYGERATGKITAHSTLLFDVELLSIETGAPAAH